MRWPPRSYDLTPYDFFLVVSNIEEFRQRLAEKFEEINNSSDMLENVFNCIKKKNYAL